MTEAEEAEAVRRYQEGWKWREIRAATGVSWNALWHALERREIPRSRRGVGRMVDCAACGQPVWRNASQLKRATEHYCCRSHKSKTEASRRPLRGRWVPCTACGKRLYRMPCQLEQAEHSFCSRAECSRWRRKAA